MNTAISTVTFTAESQHNFATVSGDWNPMHMSYLAARRTQLGQLTVHGIHVVLSALEAITASSPNLPAPSNLAVRFLKPVHVGDVVQIVQVGHSEGELRIEAVVEGATTTELRVGLGSPSPGQREIQPFTVDQNAKCCELSLSEMRGRSGQVQPAADPDKIGGRFANTAKYLGVGRVAGLLCLSRLVGMECPGMHALFRGFEVSFLSTETPSSINYCVTSVDERFRLLRIKVLGLGLHGTVAAFARHAPAPQTALQDLLSSVKPNEFTGQRALIVGGSRGLGELTAKLLAAGGGQPIITYAIGKTDAERVAEEIRQGGGQCQVLQYDVHLPPLQQIGPSTSTPYLYYYATGQIFRRRTKRFDPRILDDFLDFYVYAFYELCVCMKGLCKQPMSVFYPSSIAVEQRPRDITEYSMAKAAAEILCADLNRSWPGMHITTVRLPRLFTDQTATVVPRETGNSVDVLLPIVRAVQAIRT
jgi:NAD(P)-dependent dehydrogenase (short-subunit alcohol dehydrogenase family)